MRILIIEDNRDLAANLVDYMEERGHAADVAGDGLTGLHLATVNDYDAIVLDLMLPGMDGITLCRKLRDDARKTTPVLILTARDSLDDKIVGLESGADDYVAKPFALREVETRLHALAPPCANSWDAGAAAGGRPGVRHGHGEDHARFARHRAATHRAAPAGNPHGSMPTEKHP
jgi:DNA-binding response OmpR family regulator